MVAHSRSTDRRSSREGGERPVGEPGGMQLLFIGNSFTQRNDLPALIARLAQAADPPQVLESERVIANGASLRQHWNAGTAAGLIAAQPWDGVVLQEQSTLPVKNA